MNNILNYSLVLTFTIFSLLGCNSSSSSSNSTTSNTGNLSSQTRALGIDDVPVELAKTYSKKLKFNRYAKVIAPNNKAIHIIAQDGLTDNQIVRARSILEHYLAPLSGSKYGVDKSQVANKMTDNNAILLLLNGKDDGTNPAANLNGQPLYHDEIQVEGGPWYIAQNYEHRDASYEEILHMVHDTGIGVDQNPTFNGALPSFQADIRSAQVTALTDSIWGLGSGAQNWIQELTAENSLSQEYLAAVIDSYYGLWGAWTENATKGMWGLYIAKNRAEINLEDNLGSQLMNNQFFHPYLTYDARIDQRFTGNFSLKFDASKPYTHHAQYLKNVTLTGTASTNVIVNALDNRITGNAAYNKVVLTGNSSQYGIDKQGNGNVIVTDMVDKRDGKNTLIGIEELVFSDANVIL